MPTATFLPTGNGDTISIPTQYPASGNHYDKIDDPVADDSATYLSQNGARDTFDIFTYLPEVLGGRITNVTVYVRYSGGYDISVYATLKTHGTVYHYFCTSSSSASFRDTSYVVSTNPSTGLEWNWSEIFALQFGCRMVTSSDACFITKVWMSVDYTTIQGGENIAIIDCGGFI